jgi:hypothetical protein
VFGPGATAGDWTTGQNKLWDKLIATSAWQTYSSDNVAAAILQAPNSSTDPAWHSYLCFSCHDGTTAQLNIPTGLVATDNFLMNGGNGDIDLTNDHPVDIAWPTTDATNYELSTKVVGGTTTFNTVGMPLYGTDSRVECATCHNQHLNVTTGVTTSGNRGNFLRVSTVADNTSLCRTCHKSKR